MQQVMAMWMHGAMVHAVRNWQGGAAAMARKRLMGTLMVGAALKEMARGEDKKEISRGFHTLHLGCVEARRLGAPEEWRRNPRKEASG